MATRRRTQKKSSNNGVWIGTGISLAIIMLISVALFFKFQPGPADSASGAITEENLAKQTFKTDGLPNLGNAPGGSGSLSELLTKLGSAKTVMRSGGFEDEKDALAKEIVAALHGAAASAVPDQAFDARIPPKRFDAPELQEEIQALLKASSREVDRLIDEREFDQAQDIALSYLQLGEQVYRKNLRLKSRQAGLGMMRSGLREMGKVTRARFEDGEIEKEQMNEINAQIMEWNNAIADFEEPWKSKLKSVDSVSDPNIADIIKVAKEDRDLTFRIYGALRLGYAQYERGDEGNQKAIKEAIEALKSDSEPLVAKAAAEAESIKREEYHELRK